MAASTSSSISDGYVRMTHYFKTDEASATTLGFLAAPQTPTMQSATPINASPPSPKLSAGPYKEPAASASEDFVPVLPAHQLSFKTLVNRFAHCLPQRVQVTGANYAYGENEDALLAQDDVYDIHFIQNRQTVTLVSAERQYHVPMNSNLKFGLVYEHEHIYGSVFPTIKSIIEVENRPKVVCAQKTYIGSTPDKTVCAGEVLAISNYEATTSAAGFSFLTVYSFVCKQEKQLPFFCASNFTTASKEVQLSLREIVKNVRDPFPSKVVLFPGTSRPSDFSQRFFSQTYSMTEIRETATIIASPLLSEADNKEIEIPMEIEVKLNLIKLSEKDTAALKDDTQRIIERYDEAKIEHLWQASSIESKRHQSQLFKNVQSLDSAYYLDLCDGDESSDGDLSSAADIGLDDEKPVTPDLKEETVKELAWLKGGYIAFSKELQTLRRDLNLLQSHVTALHEGMTRSSVPNELTVFWDTTEEENRKYLRTFSSKQVLLLLTNLNLGQYCEIFAAERIDGAMLAEMDEVVLEKELCMASRLHRLKLLVVINGQQRADIK